jgi:OOP family OmpA-OmpF porin
MKRWLAGWAGAVLFSGAAALQAQGLPADASGARDHPVLTRYKGSWLVGQDVKDFDAAAIAAGPKDGDVVKVEGRITRLYYLGPAGRSVLEVQRNYEDALQKAGAVKRDACAGRNAAAARWAARSSGSRRRPPARWTAGAAAKRTVPGART